MYTCLFKDILKALSLGKTTFCEALKYVNPTDVIHDSLVTVCIVEELLVDLSEQNRVVCFPLSC